MNNQKSPLCRESKFSLFFVSLPCQVWDVPKKHFEAHRTALTFRAALIPYIATAWYQAYLTGLSIIRPCYYNWFVIPSPDLFPLF